MARPRKDGADLKTPICKACRVDEHIHCTNGVCQCTDAECATQKEAA